MKKHKVEKIGIFTHQNADPDAITSAIGLKFLLKKLLKKPEIYLFASSISSLTLQILNECSEKFFNEIKDQKLDAIFLCDTNNPIQLGSIDIQDLISNDTPIFIIDHHSKHEFVKNSTNSIIKPYTSTAEIIAMIFKEKELQLEKDLATFLITGILFDTRRFIYLSENTFSIIQFLIKSGGDYDKALSLLKRDKTISERIARLKGAQRLLIEKQEDFVIVVTQVNSFESSVARALIELGADFVAVLAKSSQNEFRLSLRCNKRYIEKQNVNLGEIANNTALKIGGSGGGHQTAAGINFTNVKNFPKRMEESLKFVLNILLEQINTQKNVN